MHLLNADLHSHSTVSDGTLAPAALAARAQANGVELWSLTDHDEIAGQASAREAALDLGMGWLSGTEISVTFAGETVHVVGLGFDVDDDALGAGLQALRSGRLERARRMADGLARAGIPGAFEGALRYVGNPDLISRTHFARFLVDSGVCADNHEVFRRYLTDGKPGYVAHRWAGLGEAVRWITGAGGVAVIAHPARCRLSPTGEYALFTEFIAHGGRAIEVVTGSHSAAEQVAMADAAVEFGLLASRGSDFHAPGESRTELGSLPDLPGRLTPVWDALAARIERASRIVVTGSAGHLGEALVRTLRADGADVVGVDRLASPWTDAVGSIADRDFVGSALRGAGAVLHAATLHKPHVATHAKQDFVDVNVTGTLALLEAAAAARLSAFVFTSTTSAFGRALTPPPGAPAAWIDETVAPRPKNVYGATKVAAEDLCELLHRETGLPCIVLRTSRFFPEPDDDPAVLAQRDALNVQANEYLYRRVDIEDVVDAHRCALREAARIGFGRYIVSATTPFTRDDAAGLRSDAAAVARRRVGGWEEVWERRGWTMFDAIDRVYDNRAARAALGWRPRTDFAAVVERLRASGDIRSPLARAIGSKGYHPA